MPPMMEGEITGRMEQKRARRHHGPLGIRPQEPSECTSVRDNPFRL